MYKCLVLSDVSEWRMLICFSLHFLRGREFIALIRRGINVSHLIPSSKYCSVQSLHGPTSANANFEYFLSFLLPRGGRRIFLRSLYCNIGNKKSTFAHIWGCLLPLSLIVLFIFLTDLCMHVATDFCIYTVMSEQSLQKNEGEKNA